MMSKKTSFVTDDLKKRSNRNTPDFLELKKKEFQFVFVYGTLQVGHSNFHYLEGEKFLGEASSVTDNFCMFDTPWGFPVASRWKRGERGAPGYLSGELFAVRPIIMLELDRLENNGVMYQREEKFFWAHDQTYQTKTRTAHPGVKAWIYLSVPDYWSDNDLKICKTIKSKDSGKSYFDWAESRKTEREEKRSMSRILDDEIPFGDDREPEYGTPEYYEKYYEWHKGTYHSR